MGRQEVFLSISTALRPMSRLVIVTDIDNTIKMCNRVWLTPAIAGMPELLSKLRSLQCSPSTGTHFTSAPQLIYLSNRYGPVSLLGFGPSRFLKLNGFPSGQIMCRPWNDLVGFLTRGTWHKSTALIAQLAGTKECILLGDSAEFDSDVYVDYACSFPTVVVYVGIRIVEDHPYNEAKFTAFAARMAREAHAKSTLFMFSSAQELSENLGL